MEFFGFILHVQLLSGLSSPVQMKTRSRQAENAKRAIEAIFAHKNFGTQNFYERKCLQMHIRYLVSFIFILSTNGLFQDFLFLLSLDRGIQ